MTSKAAAISDATTSFISVNIDSSDEKYNMFPEDSLNNPSMPSTGKDSHKGFLFAVGFLCLAGGFIAYQQGESSRTGGEIGMGIGGGLILAQFVCSYWQKEWV